jgi:hypothetical protein
MRSRIPLVLLPLTLLLCLLPQCTAMRVEQAGRQAALRYHGPRHQLFPTHLPFAYRRDSAGVALTPQEVQAFTRRVTSFYREHDFFRWLLRTSFGMDSSASAHDFMVWWHGMQAVKQSGRVTFTHIRGGPDNIMMETARMLGQMACGYLLTGDSVMGRIVEQYSKGVCAQFQGMVWSDTDTVRTVMARAVMPPNHRRVLDTGDTASVDYSAWRRESSGWNAQTMHVPANPYWGDVWVRSMRSKDDLPNLMRAGVWLGWVARDGRDARVREAALQAHDALAGFATDIVGHGYRIRTRNREGVIYVPTQDLASLSTYDVVSPRGECPGKLTLAQYAFARPLRNNCGPGYGTLYDMIAPRGHFYNLAIIRGFQMTATLTALTNGRNRTARRLLDGLTDRAEDVFSLKNGYGNTTPQKWREAGAVFLLQAAACGLPLNWSEVRLVQREFGRALDSLNTWPHWNLWDKAVPDGEYEYKPLLPIIGVEQMGYLLEYCFSPFRNSSGAPCVDCDIIRDPSRW